MSAQNFGVAAEFSLGRVSFFNPATLRVTQQKTLGYEFVEQAITGDCTRTVSVSDGSRRLVEFNTDVTPAAVDAVRQASSNLGDVDITPDDRFAVISSFQSPWFIQSYSLWKNKFISSIPAPTNSFGVAVSPTDNGQVLTNLVGEDRVRLFKIYPDGRLMDTGKSTISGGTFTFNSRFTPDGNFVFVANFDGNNVGILWAQTPNNLTFLKAVGTNTEPRSLVISPEGTKVFVLTANTVDVFFFNRPGRTLDLLYTFGHGLDLGPALAGVTQIALDPDSNRLFIAAGGTGELRAFTTLGAVVGRVPGIQPFGGVDICSPPMNN